MSNNKHRAEDSKFRPDWADEAANNPSKPDWVDAVPHELWEFGQVFFPIPNQQKAWEYPHHVPSMRYKPDDEVFNAYLESNANYGISCAEDIAVVDIDELEYIDHIRSQLPDTVWQRTGSRSGVHLFFKCRGLTSRIILRIPHPAQHMAAEGHERISGTTSRHIGEVKCDPHGYVVGPGSVHPSGNQYGPLEGDGVINIPQGELKDGLSEYVHETAVNTSVPDIERKHASTNTDSKYEFYNLDKDDVIPWLEAGARVPHPSHGSSTGTNFMKSEDDNVFMCWRHNYGGGQGCALNPQQLLAVMRTSIECDRVRANWTDDSTLHYHAWMEAVDRGLVTTQSIPYRVAKGYAVENNWLIEDEKLSGKTYWDAINATRCVARDMILPEYEPLE